MSIPKAADSEYVKGVLAAGAAQALFGTGPFFIKIATNYASPQTILLLRYLLASVLINIVWIGGRKKLTLKGKK